MATPSQAQIECKGCGQLAEPHRSHKLFCEACARRKNVNYQRADRERQKAKPRIVICKGCGRAFDASGNGRTWRCQPCITAYQAELRQRDKERHRQYSRDYRAKMGEAYRTKMRRRRGDLLAQMTPEQQAEFRRRESEKSGRLFRALRDEVYAAYGGFVCACCGETERLFLTIDHVENDGAKMRQEGTHGRSGTAFYQWLRRQGFPAGFQVLCLNCNIGKHRNGGVCPHQSEKV